MRGLIRTICVAWRAPFWICAALDCKQVVGSSVEIEAVGEAVVSLATASTDGGCGITG